MTGDGFRDKFDPAKRVNELRKATADDNGVTADSAQGSAAGEEAFSIVSADRQQKVMVEFRFKNGNAKALAYSFLVAANFDPSNGISLDFSGYGVTIAGRNLESLFTGIVAQRVAVVREMDALHAEATLPEDAPTVTRIEVSESS